LKQKEFGRIHILPDFCSDVQSAAFTKRKSSNSKHLKKAVCAAKHLNGAGVKSATLHNTHAAT